MARAHENAAQRISSAALEEGAPGVHRAADGSVFLRGRRGEAGGIRSAKSVASRRSPVASKEQDGHVVSGSRRVAEGDGLGDRRVPSDWFLPQGRDLWTYITDASSGGLGAQQHR